ncbi:MAG TPA: inorganic diphosphatase [Abditibacteriaceae bacterium]|jgi:inorganic pyrophosphatase
MVTHPWHGIDPGKRAPEIVDCVIEVPRGSHNKYELDKPTGLLRLDRVLHSAVFYPANYGFIPRTYCDDRDPLDILVLGQEPVVPMCILTARPIGVMQMVDQNEEDDKIIAIHEHDPAVAHYRDISMLPEHTLNELQRFFEDYKALEKKKVRIERFKGRIDAQEIIQAALRLYDQSYSADGSKRADAPILASEMRTDTPAGDAYARTPSRNARTDAARRAAVRLQASDAGASAPPVDLDSDSAGSSLFVPQSPDVPRSWVMDEHTLGAHAPRKDSVKPEADSAETGTQIGTTPEANTSPLLVAPLPETGETAEQAQATVSTVDESAQTKA